MTTSRLIAMLRERRKRRDGKSLLAWERLDSKLGAGPGWGLTLVIAWTGALIQLALLLVAIFYLH